MSEKKDNLFKSIPTLYALGGYAYDNDEMVDMDINEDYQMPAFIEPFPEISAEAFEEYYKNNQEDDLLDAFEKFINM